MLKSLASLFQGLRPDRRRMYEGAAGGRRWSAGVDMPSTNAAILASRGPLSRRARYFEGNNPLAASGVGVWESALVGAGITPMSAHPDSSVRETLQRHWETWTDYADADEMSDFYGIQRVMARRMVIDGEAFAVLVTTPEGFRIRLIDAEQVDTALHRELPGGGRIVAGVEFNAAGRRVAYHILRERSGLPLATSLDTVRLDARDVIHLFKPVTPGQVRGLSWFVSILLRLSEHDQSIDAQLVRQKIAALLTGFIRDPNGTAGGFSGTTAPTDALDVSLEPGTLKVLGPGQDITFSDPAKVGSEVIDFLKVSAREIAAGLGVPYEAITGDLSDVNYSSIRAGLVEFRRRVEAIQHQVIVFQACRPIWRRFVMTEILAGRVQAPDFFRNPEPYLLARWMPPKTDWVDPKNDVEAELAAIAGGLVSRRKAVAARGYDVEEIDREIADDQRREGELGLDFTQKPSGVAA
ncbi:phage portal protein [Microvirga sp. HBU67558]|uniref:phage portal protein n=1 Tax=Microvirga TaxID=186650 RepID=UPI001B37FF84|nr:MULTISPECIES: phage portal protein [unclassified Microvirga]MBQ0822106.1 phage portal protein [Microvirga sp. HBU67558]